MPLITLPQRPFRYACTRGLLVLPAAAAFLVLGTPSASGAFVAAHTGFANRACCWVDYDNDGRLDLHDGATLWRNTGSGFANVFTIGSGNSVWGDYDNDGFTDLYGGVGTLMHNDAGSGGFTAMPFPALPMAASQAANWGDHNGDGYVDLYVGGFGGQTDAFVVNHHGSSFTKALEFPGLFARGVTSCDFDEDSDIDVYVSNYWQAPNLLWLNNGAGGFTEQGAAYGIAGDPGVGAGYAHTIGSAWGDLDNDGHFDLFVGNFNHHDSRISEDSKFYRNLGPSGGFLFEDKSATAGLAWQESYASPALADYDNDGDLDLFLTTVYATASGGIPNNPVLYRNNGDWTFTDVTAAEGVSGLGATYQAAWGDYDGDGDLDLVTDGKVFENLASGNHWLKVHLTGNGTSVNRSAIGAQVRIEVGGETLTRQVEAGTGEGNQNELTLHFGLGHHAGRVTVEIRWPDGTTKTIPEVDVDQVITQDTPPAPPLAAIGSPGPANGWDSSGSVSVRAGHQRVDRPAIATINGTGIGQDGALHSNYETDMWLSTELDLPGRFGATPGGHWIEYAFDKVYDLEKMWIWGYAEGDLGSYLWSAMGLREVTIQYTALGGGGPGGAWGSDNPGDWTEVFAGDLDVYDPGQPRSPSDVVDFGGVQARYVLITSSTDDTTVNYVYEKENGFYPNDDAGLSEVRFFAVAEIEVGGMQVRGDTAFRIQTEAGKTYRLERATTLSPPDWAPTGCYVEGDGAPRLAFDPAGYSASMFYRIMEEE